MECKLHDKKCKPCKGGTPPLSEDAIIQLSAEIDNWIYDKEKQTIAKKFKFKNFVESMKFVNKIAEIAEDEGHHPDILINWNKVTLTLTTHAAKGLTENDFIVAAKIDKLK